jgi:hypothetical protein
MMTRICRSAAIAALLAFQPLAIAHVEAGDPGRAPAAAPDKTKQICRVETPTGSIRPVRTCHTRAEWEAAAQQRSADRDQLDTNQTRQRSLTSARS